VSPCPAIEERKKQKYESRIAKKWLNKQTSIGDWKNLTFFTLLFTSFRRFVRFHVGTQHRIHARLIPFACVPEKIQHFGINAQGDLLFGME
jgi:hypothetical protein